MDPVNENFTRLFNRTKHMNEQGDHTGSNRADIESAPTRVIENHITLKYNVLRREYYGNGRGCG